MSNANQLLSHLLLASHKMNFCNYNHVQFPFAKERNTDFLSSLHLTEGILWQKSYQKGSGDEDSTSEIMTGTEITSVH